MEQMDSKRIFGFLADTNRRELAFEYNGWQYAVLKGTYDDETDFLYILRECHSINAYSVGGKAEFAGIYSRLHGMLISDCYDLRFLDLPMENTLASVEKKLSEMVLETVLRKIDGKPIPETSESKTPWHDRDYYLKYELDREALRCFYDGQFPALISSILLEDKSTDIYVGAINHPVEIAERLADDYMHENAKIINLRLWELSLLPDKVAELEATPGEHHFRRKIAASIDPDSMKMVSIDILKDGKPLSCKIKAYALKSADGCDYSTWHMDSTGARAFEQLYGREARLLASDITRITYGRRVLYENA